MPLSPRRLVCSVVAAVAAGVALAAPAAIAAPDDYPKLKAGLWEMSTSNSRTPGVKAVSTLCLDVSLQQEMVKMSSGMMSGMCSRSELKAVGATFVGEAVCNFNGSTMKARSVMTLKGDSSYRTESKATFDPPFMGQSESSTVIEGRNIGACRPGQQPGDLTTPTGQTINIRNVMNSKK